MSFDAVVGHEEAKSRFRRLLAADRLAHAYLVHGEEGIGKFRLALEVAGARLCPELTEDACGQCLDCRLVKAGSHPDLFLLDDPDAASLHIDQVRALIDTTVRKPVRSPGRAYVIRDAERLREEAQNALLKTLEEPPPGSLILLTSDRPQGLVPTLRSRCQELRLKPLTQEETLQVLQSTDLQWERIELLSLISGGSPGKALAMEAGAYLDLRYHVLTLVGGETSDPLGLAEAVFSGLNPRDPGIRSRARMVVETWISVLRDLLVVHAGQGAEEAWNRDLAPEIARVVRTSPSGILENHLVSALDSLRSLSVNASPDLVLGDLAISLRFPDERR